MLDEPPGLQGGGRGGFLTGTLILFFGAGTQGQLGEANEKFLVLSRGVMTSQSCVHPVRVR